MKKRFLFFPLFLFAINLTFSQTWDGGGDGTSWDDPLNWDNDMVPAAGDLVVFGMDVTVTGTAPNAPSRIDVQSNNTVTLDLNLSVGDGITSAHCLKVQGNATLNLASGRTFTLTPGFNEYAILHNANNNPATVNIMAGATVNVVQGNRGVSITGTGGNILNNMGTFTLSNNSTGIYNETGAVNNLAGGLITINPPNDDCIELTGGSLTNAGTINAEVAAAAGSNSHGLFVGTGSTMENTGTITLTGGNAARRMLVDGMATNGICGIIDMTDGRLRVNDGNFVNNGLLRSMWSGTSVFISGTGTTTNNAFFNNPNNDNFAAGGPFTDNGVSVNDPADMTVDAASSCAFTLPIMAAYGWFDDAGNTNPVGNNTMDGALSFDSGVFAAAGNQTIYTCFGNEVVFSVENVDGPCIFSACDLVINEVDYDQPGFPDVAEFIEIYNPCSAAIHLDGYQVRLFNGANGGNYQNIPLPAVSLAAGDYFVICNDGATVPNCDLVAINSLQNGSPDVVILEKDGVQVDGLSYEGDNANTAPYVEGTGTSAEDNNSDEAIGLARFPDGNDTDNNDADFALRCITPGEANVSTATDCLPCMISSISVGNISTCNDNGTPDPSDDFFTADVTVTFTDKPSNGNLDLSGDGTASVSVVGLTSPHTFTGVQMSADGSSISLTATFSTFSTCTLTNSNAGTAPSACSVAPCAISDISVGNISACDDNGTADPADDFFTADVSVTFENAPASGTLDLTGDGSASVSVVGLTSPHVFTGVQMSADGTDISLTATFSDDPACTLENTNAGTAPMACSIAPCDISDISVANISGCDDNGTPLPGDDFITVDVTVTFANPPATGTLDLSVGGTASVGVGQLDGPTSHTFIGVVMSADGGVINFEASFSDDAACNFYKGEIDEKPEPCSCSPIINEVDYSQPGNDNAEFVEIYNPCGSAINLGNFQLVFVNGATSSNYQTVNLPNVDLAPGEYFVVCSNDNPAAYCDLQAIGNFQNGDPDAVSLRFNGTQVDGLSYGGDVPGVVEGSGAGLVDDDSEEAVGLSRFPNGTDTDQNNVDFSLRCITPGMANDNASAAGCLNCGIASITVSNISDCQGFGTGDPSDDVFTADVTVTFADRPNTGLLVLSGDGSANVNANGLTSPHTFTNVEMTADGSAISLTATFNNLPTCTLTENNAGMAPASCSGCDITEIILTNVSTCSDNGTTDPSDDTFTADVTVNYVNPPSPGTLVLSGDASASVSVGPGSTSHTLGGVVFSADGGVISLTANFQEESGCSFTDDDLGTAPASCSPCDISGISLSNVSSCDDNGTANPADDFFTADVTVFFQNPPATGVLNLSGSGLGVVTVSGLGTSYTFEDVMMAANGNVLSFTAEFSDNPTCSFTNFEAGIAPSSCSPCGIESISLSNISACENQATIDPDDDTFTADVTVTYFQAPASGTLDLSGDATASTSTFGANSAIFTNVEFSSNGSAINLTASFSANPACSLSANVGTAPPPCSDDCFIAITDIIVENESCPGYGNGTITILVNTIPGAQVGYSVDGGATFQLTNHFEFLSPGAYPIYVQVFGQNDCNATGMATVLPAPASALQTWYQDWDDDSHSNGVTVEACEQPTGFKLPAALLSLDGDCDDYDPLAIPGQTWWKDSDGDGHSDGTSLTQCIRPAGYAAASELTATSGDCDDDNPTTYPGAPEICNGIDDDCDGEVDEGAVGGMTWVGNVSFTTQAQVDAWSNCYSIIDGNLTIQNSVIIDLTNLSALVEVTGNVLIKSTGLTSLTGLEGLTTIGGYLQVQSNNELVTLDGLENVVTVGSYLRVYYNANLTDCCAIHDLLTNSGVGGSITIRRNETGCDSVNEINTDCGSGNNLIAPPTGGVSISENALEAQSINVFPNPTSGILNVRLAKDFESAYLQMFDLQGRLVYQSELENSIPSAKIETGHLTKGMFLLHVLVDGESFTERIIVE